MKWFVPLPLLLTIIVAMASSTAFAAGRFDGRYCRGEGDVAFLELIDDSFAFFHANPNVPNLTMVYEPGWDTFCEGAGWGGWWPGATRRCSRACVCFRGRTRPRYGRSCPINT